jgi:hypothetical protein
MSLLVTWTKTIFGTLKVFLNMQVWVVAQIIFDTLRHVVGQCVANENKN